MNPSFDQLQSYPFQKLAALTGAVTPPPELKRISLHIGEPKHPTPEFIKRALTENLGGLANYPTTLGAPSLRVAIAEWMRRRYGLTDINAETQIIPVNGSREALFAFAQTVVDRTRAAPVVVVPNPFYQIYEGAALLAGATPQYLHTLPGNGFALDFAQLSDDVWQRTQLVYVCSPGNPTGRVMTLDEWQRLFALSDRYGFVIAADECYSEIYFDETQPPLGALQAARQCGRAGFPRLVMFSSLSKRSNVPGMRKLPREYRHEPAIALASGQDGLDAVRVILREAAALLTDKGLLVVEVGHHRPRVERAFARYPFVWPQTSGGDDCVFILSRADLLRARASAERPAALRAPAPRRASRAAAASRRK